MSVNCEQLDDILSGLRGDHQTAEMMVLTPKEIIIVMTVMVELVAMAVASQVLAVRSECEGSFCETLTLDLGHEWSMGVCQALQSLRGNTSAWGLHQTPPFLLCVYTCLLLSVAQVQTAP